MRHKVYPSSTSRRRRENKKRQQRLRSTLKRWLRQPKNAQSTNHPDLLQAFIIQTVQKEVSHRLHTELPKAVNRAIHPPTKTRAKTLAHKRQRIRRQKTRFQVQYATHAGACQSLTLQYVRPNKIQKSTPVTPRQRLTSRLHALNTIRHQHTRNARHALTQAQHKTHTVIRTTKMAIHTLFKVNNTPTAVTPQPISSIPVTPKSHHSRLAVAPTPQNTSRTSDRRNHVKENRHSRPHA